MLFKCFVPILFLALVSLSQGKPTADQIGEGRGIGSTLWGWITYPFSWWSSSEIEFPPINDQIIGSPYTPYDNIEVARRNVTVWCNDQTCTTLKCDKFGCKNTTCNIYDTDMRGECREYNTDLKPEEPIPPKPVTTTSDSTPNDKVTEPSATTSSAPAATSSTTQDTNQSIEHPLELEAVLSSTVTEGKPETETQEVKTKKTSSPLNKI